MSNIAAEHILERALNYVACAEGPTNPMLLLSRLALADGPAADLRTHKDVILLLEYQVNGLLTKWWIEKQRTKEECVKLFEDALFEARLTG